MSLRDDFVPSAIAGACFGFAFTCAAIAFGLRGGRPAAEPEIAGRSPDFQHGYRMANAHALLDTAVRTRRIAQMVHDNDAADVRRMIDGAEYVHIAALEAR